MCYCCFSLAPCRKCDNHHDAKILQQFKHKSNTLRNKNVSVQKKANQTKQHKVQLASSNYIKSSSLSKSALELHQTIFQLRQTRTVDIIWIPAHCGITLHDRADFLATQANNQITRSFLGQVALQPWWPDHQRTSYLLLLLKNNRLMVWLKRLIL